MAGKKCVVCTKVKGKRACQLNDNALICSRCCAQVRTYNCEGCRHYASSEQYTKNKELAKTQKSKDKPFIMRIDPVVEESLDEALAMIANDNLSAGEAIISDLFTENPDLHSVRYAMGVVCVKKEQYDEALAHFDKAIEIFPYFIEAWFNKGATNHYKMEITESIRAYQKVVEFGKPTTEFVRNANNIVTAMEKRVYEESGISLETFLKGGEIFAVAFAHMRNQEYEKAVDGFQAVLAVNPNHPQSYGNMGICYGLLGKKSEAITAFDKALELKPDYEPAIVNRDFFSSNEEGKESSQDIALVSAKEDGKESSKELALVSANEDGKKSSKELVLVSANEDGKELPLNLNDNLVENKSPKSKKSLIRRFFELFKKS